MHCTPKNTLTEVLQVLHLSGARLFFGEKQLGRLNISLNDLGVTAGATLTAHVKHAAFLPGGAGEVPDHGQFVRRASLPRAAKTTPTAEATHDPPTPSPRRPAPAPEPRTPTPGVQIADDDFIGATSSEAHAQSLIGVHVERFFEVNGRAKPFVGKVRGYEVFPKFRRQNPARGLVRRRQHHCRMVMVRSARWCRGIYSPANHPRDPNTCGATPGSTAVAASSRRSVSATGASDYSSWHTRLLRELPLLRCFSRREYRGPHCAS